MLFVGCDSDDAGSRPVAANDTVQTSPGQAATISVLANDTGEGLTIDSFQERTPSRGRVSKNESEQLVYRPGPGFLGTDVFTYAARDAQGVVTKNATVTVTVQ